MTGQGDYYIMRYEDSAIMTIDGSFSDKLEDTHRLTEEEADKLANEMNKNTNNEIYCAAIATWA